MAAKGRYRNKELATGCNKGTAMGCPSRRDTDTNWLRGYTPTTSTTFAPERLLSL
jgi:hypothetical protein